MKLFFNSIYYLLIAGIVLMALLLSTSFLPIPGNFKVKVVKSGSMEPTIMTGSIVVLKPEVAYAVGDIVTFGADTRTQIPTTHRIVDISKDANPVYTTKGDANNAADQVVTHLSDIHGKVLFSVPYVGYVLAFAKTLLGFALLVGVPALAIILEEVGKIVREIRRMRRERREPEQRIARMDRSNYITHVPHTYRLQNVIDLRR